MKPEERTPSHAVLVAEPNSLPMGKCPFGVVFYVLVMNSVPCALLFKFVLIFESKRFYNLSGLPVAGRTSVFTKLFILFLPSFDEIGFMMAALPVAPGGPTVL